MLKSLRQERESKIAFGILIGVRSFVSLFVEESEGKIVFSFFYAILEFLCRKGK